MAHCLTSTKMWYIYIVLSGPGVIYFDDMFEAPGSGKKKGKWKFYSYKINKLVGSIISLENIILKFVLTYVLDNTGEHQQRGDEKFLKNLNLLDQHPWQ